MSWIFRDLIILVVLLVAGVVVFYAHNALPQELQDKLKGIKTYIIGVIGVIAPLIVDFATQIQGLGLEQFVPSASQVAVTQGMGLLMIVCRMWTARHPT